MKMLKISMLILFAIGFRSLPYTNNSVYSQAGISEAPTGFDNQTNGFVDQATHDADREVFEERVARLRDQYTVARVAKQFEQPAVRFTGTR